MLTRPVLVAALAATIAIGACSAATVTPAASPSAAPTVAAPSLAAASAAPTLDAPSVTPQSVAPAAPGQPQTIHLTLQPGNDTDISVDRSKTACNTEYCRGDYRLGDDSLFDAGSGKQVGTLAYVEYVVTTDDPLWLSPADTITLDGRGQIVFSELLHDDQSGRPATGAILGGTGEFTGVTGYVTSRSLGGHGDFVITITR